MLRKDRHELDIWCSNWRVGWKLQTKDMKFSRSEQVHVPNFAGCQGRRTGVAVTTVSNSLILGGWVTKVLKIGDEKLGGGGG